MSYNASVQQKQRKGDYSYKAEIYSQFILYSNRCRLQDGEKTSRDTKLQRADAVLGMTDEVRYRSIVVLQPFL